MVENAIIGGKYYKYGNWIHCEKVIVVGASKEYDGYYELKGIDFPGSSGCHKSQLFENKQDLDEWHQLQMNGDYDKLKKECGTKEKFLKKIFDRSVCHSESGYNSGEIEAIKDLMKELFDVEVK